MKGMNVKEKKTETVKKVPQEMIPYYEDEVSLIDIAITLVKRRNIFFLAFLFVFGITIFLTINTYLNRSQTFVSVYKVALEGTPAELPASTIEVIDSFYKEVVLTELNDLSFSGIEVKATNPAGTNIILLSTETSEAQIEKVKIFHTKILEKVKESQDKILAKDLKNLEDQMTDSRKELEVIRKEKEDMRLIRHEKAPEAIVGFTNQIMTIEARIKEMEKKRFFFKEGEIVQVGEKKLSKLSSGAGKLLLIGLIISLVLGVVAVFIFEFIESVKQKFSEIAKGDEK